jgi:hypothetical protein
MDGWNALAGVIARKSWLTTSTRMNHRTGLWLMVCQVKRGGKGGEMMVAKELQRMCKRDAEELLAASGLRLLLVRLLLFLATTMLPHLTAHHRQYLFPQLRPAQKPAPPHRFPFPRRVLPSPRGLKVNTLFYNSWD